jgi:predicted metal-dependent hydrolase
MSKKSQKIVELIHDCQGQPADPHYLGYFRCFNRQLFFEAHDVLEELWLRDRHGPDGAYHKGLIQLAGAFVHLQKKRPGPATALFKLARTNLTPYAPMHAQLNVQQVLELIETWVKRVELDGLQELNPDSAPQLTLLNINDL